MDFCTVDCPKAENTRHAAESLRYTLYTGPCTLTFSGELGAGKTTFLQSFIRSLGGHDHVPSPTFALEQRYETNLGRLIHIDLYRLNERQSRELLHSTDDAYELRCIEWPQRAGDALKNERPLLRLEFTEIGDGRQITCHFEDIPFPTREQIKQWRTDVRLPVHVARHCDAVADACEKLGKQILGSGRFLRPLALRRAAEVHDLLRFLDFKPGAGPANANHSPDDLQTWDALRKKYDGLKHEAACAEFLKEQGFDALSCIVAPHGLGLPPESRITVEQKILYYADKRVMEDRFVTVDERFADFKERYAKGKTTAEQQQWMEEVKGVERELFPDGL